MSLVDQAMLQFFSANPSPMMLVHPRGCAVARVNDGYTRAFGYTDADLAGQAFPSLKQFTDHKQLREVVDCLESGEELKDYPLRLRTRQGDLRDALVSIASFTLDNSDLALMTFVDITHLTRFEQELVESERNLKRSQAIAHVGHWSWDTRTNRVTWSDEMYRIFGLEPQSITGDLDEIVRNAIHPDDRERVIALNQAVVESGRPAEAEYRVVWPDGSVHTVWAIPGDATLDHQGHIVRLFGIVQEITERRAAEKKIEKLARLYGTLSQVNQTIVRVRDEETLFKEICRVAVEYGQFNLAWIGLVDRTSGEVRPVAHHGYADIEFTLPPINLHDSVFDRSAMGIAFRSEKVLLVHDVLTDPRIKYLKPLAEKYNFFSLAFVPFRRNGEVIGFLNLDSAEKEYFDEDDIRLLEEISLDISFALDTIEVEKHRRLTEQSLRESEHRYSTLFENLLNGFALCKMVFENGKPKDFMYLLVNRAFEQLTGLKDVTGKWVTEVIPGIRESDDGLFEIYGRVVLTGKPEKFEIYVKALKMWFSVSVYSPEREHFVAVFEVITARKEAERKIEEQVERLTALRKIDEAITGSLELKTMFAIILEQVCTLLHIDAAAILLYNPKLNWLSLAAAHGFRGKRIARLTLRLGEDYAGRSALERRMIAVPDLASADPPLEKGELIAGEDFHCMLDVPLISGGQVKGVLEVFHRSPLEPDAEWIDLFEMLANQAAIAIDKAQTYDELARSNIELLNAYDETIEGWSRALDLRDKETEGHTQRVTEMTLRLADAFGVSDTEIVHMRRGALLHDIGKLGVPDYILFKAGQLSDEEMAAMQKHPQYAYDMLSPIAFLRPATDIPYCHHEKWDGSGYPRGLKGEVIPLSARIFAVIDVWDALCSDRPYRPAWSKEKARAYIKAQSGKHFDPAVVEKFLLMLQEFGEDM